MIKFAENKGGRGIGLMHLNMINDPVKSQKIVLVLLTHTK